MTIYSFGLGIGSKDSQGNWLEVYYPQPLLSPSAAMIDKLAAACGYEGGNQVVELDPGRLESLAVDFGAAEPGPLLARLASSVRPVVATFLGSDAKPASVPEVYLKLHLISQRLVRPHGTSLDGMFGVLPNVAWTNQGAIAIDELAGRQLDARLKGEVLEVNCVDKFPKMTDYVVPAGVRIADTARVRLGAFIGEGTTIMHEGFVNFNAGSAGKAMIEGRISAGVFVEAGSDLGGGCSIMGTLSGGGKEVISVGRDSLVGANAGLGISLGDRCIVEAGLYVTGGTKVQILDQDNNVVETVKARDLSGRNDLLFRRNSLTGAVECKTNKTRVELNEELHAHN